MRKALFFLAGIMIMLTYSCGNQGWKKNQKTSENSITQADDGTISLTLENAAFYSNAKNPSGNTAEWSVVVSQPGRYGVWLASATKDTVDLSYTNSVKVTMLDTHLEVIPEADKIIQNSGDVTYPFYRADSYMGSFFISEPGVYNIQVISEKVIQREAKNEPRYQADNTRLMSVILKPNTR
ncbi:MAG: hypothetical protein R6W81_12225 [Bacteroidales bacterium]